MQDLPHHYKVRAVADPQADVSLESENIPSITSAPPAEFGGPGNRWSPETLMVAAVADCFVLTFRAIARSSKFSWVSLTSEVEATLERAGGSMKFTEFKIRARLGVPRDVNEQRAQRLLQKAEESCLITNSLSAKTHLETEMEFPNQ